MKSLRVGPLLKRERVRSSRTGSRVSVEKDFSVLRVAMVVAVCRL
jgi:hypothetical protein